MKVTKPDRHFVLSIFAMGREIDTVYWAKVGKNL